jgi:SAM-dependent methyltransferase
VAQDCYLCGRSTTRLVVANAHYSYLVCSSCGFRMQQGDAISEADQELYDDEFYAERGLDISLDRQDPMMRNLIMHRVDTLTAILGHPGSLLDIGAGTGLFVQASTMKGWRAVGIEKSAAAVRIADRIGAGVVTQGGLEELASGQRFDAVTLWDVLEHLEDPRLALKKTHDLLQAGGLVAISLPNVAGMKARILGNRWRYYRHSFGHRSHFSPGTLTTLLGQANFVPVRVQTSGHFNLGKPFGLGPAQVRQSHRILSKLQSLVDAAAGGLGVGEDLLVIARRAD